jgi:hypothetical protein
MTIGSKNCSEQRLLHPIGEEELNRKHKTGENSDDTSAVGRLSASTLGFRTLSGLLPDTNATYRTILVWYSWPAF